MCMFLAKKHPSYEKNFWKKAVLGDANALPTFAILSAVLSWTSTLIFCIMIAVMLMINSNSYASRETLYY